MIAGQVSKTIVMGLGNPILGDDGVGWVVAHEVQRLTWKMPLGSCPPISVECSSLGGLSLMEDLVGYDEAILIDALSLDGPPGTILCFPLGRLPDSAARHAGSPHDTSLPTALNAGRALGISLPEKITVVGIVACQLYDFRETLSPEVAASVQPAARVVLDLLAKKYSVIALHRGGTFAPHDVPRAGRSKEKGSLSTMNELNLTQKMLHETLLDAAREGGERVRRVNILLGDSSHECEESIQQYWKYLSTGTPAEGAQLHFRRSSGELRCVDCGSVFPMAEASGECPYCLSPRLRLIGGEEVRLESIDVE